MRPRRRCWPAGLLCWTCTACASGASQPSLEDLYEENRADLGGGSEEDQAEVETRRAWRVAETRERVESGADLNVEDLLHAAAVLLDSSDLADLSLAETLALEAAEAGEDRGFPIAAEAIDRQCVLLGIPQRYGTQYILPAGSRVWVLYPTDPATSDTERRAMGLPTLAEAVARASEIE